MLSYTDVPEEIFQYIFKNYRKLSYSELSEKLSISIDDVQNILATWKSDFNHYPLPRIKYEEFSDKWKAEMIEFYKTHSFNTTINYFFVQGKFIRQCLAEHNIPEHTRAEALNLTRLEHYGSHENYVAEMVKHSRETSYDRYGTDNFAKTEEFVVKSKATCMKNFGVDNPMKSEDVKQTFQENMLAKTGHRWPQQVPEVLEKRLNTCKERHGGSGWASPTIYETFLDTMDERYHGRHWRESDILTARVQQTCREKHDVDWPCLYPEVRLSMSNDSGPNREFEELLQSNRIEYEREFGIGRYSYDFKVGNTLVEIDPSATHNSTWNPFGGDPFDDKYHVRKTQCAFDNGYRCIHVWDWDNKDLILKQLKIRDRVYARNCVCKNINAAESSAFLKQYHVQGAVKASVHIGLFYNNVLVSVMTFGTPRYNKNYEWELLRYASSHQVVGGAEKLFKFFVSHESPTSVISYCDLSKFTGEVYTKLGFEHKGTNVGKHWYNMYTKKHITDNLLRQRGFDQLFNTDFGKGTSNEQLMLDHKFVEIYDAGQATYVWKHS